MQAKSLLYVALPVVAIAVLYLVFKPPQAPEARHVPPAPVTLAPAVPATPATAAPALPAEPVRVSYSKPNTYDIVVRGGRRISEAAILKVKKGDEVTLRITSDRPEEFHLHGYNLHAHVTPDKTTTLQFTAKLTGRFVYEFHRSGLELGALEVYPK